MKRLVEIVRNNIRLIVVLLIIILIGTIGITFALSFASFRGIGIDSTMLDIDASISYDSSSNGASVISTGDMLPISDDLVTGVNVTDSRVLKVKFNVSGTSDNPDNTIYDVALRDINMDCMLKISNLKWRLYKNNSLISSGNMSPEFDTMANDRLVLTNTQQDLGSAIDQYVLLMWFSESCSSDDITSCNSEMDQSLFLNKTFSFSIKIELSTKSKKNLVRVTGTEGSCEYVVVNVPVCNSLSYTGNSLVLVNSGTGYKLINSNGTNIGNYVVTAKLLDGYKWNDGSTEDKLIYCSISS